MSIKILLETKNSKVIYLQLKRTKIGSLFYINTGQFETRPSEIGTGNQNKESVNFNIEYIE